VNTIPVTIVGNLTDDPELRYTPSGDAVVRVTIAQTPRRRGQDGTWSDGEATFLTGTAWRQLAEHVAESLAKGARVIAAGTMRTERWTDKESGQPRSRMVLDITAIGPELSFATASVKKAKRDQGAPDDPWATASKTRPEAAPGDAESTPWPADEPAF
jgi:single-strand DNA-binding protein